MDKKKTPKKKAVKKTVKKKAVKKKAVKKTVKKKTKRKVRATPRKAKVTRAKARKAVKKVSDKDLSAKWKNSVGPGSSKKCKRKSKALKLICSCCDTPKTSTKKQVDKLIAAFGSKENLLMKYHCIECRKKFNVRRDGRLKPIVQKRKPKPKTKCWKPRIKYKEIWNRPVDVPEAKWTSAISSSIKAALKSGLVTK